MKEMVVSIHDVSPRSREACDAMLNDLARLNITRTSLLVVPDHHHRGHFLDDPDFCRWLAARAARGHEIVIHGYFHQRERVAGARLRDRFMTQVYTAGEGEFFDLSHAEAAALIGRAQSDFDRFHREYAPDVAPPVGFIAPAWLLGAEAGAAVRDAGLWYTTRLATFENLRTGQTIHSQSLVYSPRSAWRRLASRGWNAWLARRLRSNPLLRLGLHPPDRDFPALWNQILQLAAAARNERDVATYGDLVTRSAIH